MANLLFRYACGRREIGGKGTGGYLFCLCFHVGGTSGGHGFMTVGLAMAMRIICSIHRVGLAS